MNNYNNLSDETEFDDSTDLIDDIINLESYKDNAINSNAIQLYFKEISKYKPLSIDEEKELGHLIQQGDIKALKKLVLYNLKFVVFIANKYKNTGIPIFDIIEQGNLGLLEAAKRYKPDKNVKFISYAVWWIRQAIIQGLTEQSGSVRLPVKQAYILFKINNTSELLMKSLNREPTTKELSENTGISEEDINNILRASKQNLSLDAPYSETSDKSFLDYLEDTAPNIEDELIRKTLKLSIDEIVSDLSERETNIITKRYGLDGDEPQTLEEIGEKLHLSRERVRQIEVKAMDKLKKKAIKRKLDEYLN